MARIALVSYRLGGVDGVSIEATKWANALATLGHEVVQVAGEGTCDRLVPGLSYTSGEEPDEPGLRSALADVDLVIVENVASLALKESVREVIYRVLERRPALFRHHDANFERTTLGHLAPPRPGPHWRHVAISQRLARGLQVRGLDTRVIYNHFDLDPPLGRRDELRGVLKVDGPLVVLPSRALWRKNIPAALSLAAQLDATFWLLGASEDGYEETLAAELARHDGPVRRGLPEGFTIDDAYAASDLVAFTSTLEGLGNPCLEGPTHGRAVAVTHYPVLDELRALGCSFVDSGDVDGARRALDDPSPYVDAGRRVVATHLNLADLPGRLNELLGDVDPALRG